MLHRSHWMQTWKKEKRKKWTKHQKSPQKWKWQKISSRVNSEKDSVTTYHFDSMAQLSALVFVSQSTSPDSLVRRSIFIVYRSPRNLFSLRNSPAGYSGRSLLHSSRVARMQFHVQLKPRGSRNLGRRSYVPGCLPIPARSRDFSAKNKKKKKKRTELLGFGNYLDAMVARKIDVSNSPLRDGVFRDLMDWNLLLSILFRFFPIVFITKNVICYLYSNFVIWLFDDHDLRI